jgi:mannose-6-phosphate isomerase-like protein (cupin superfamily)
VDLLAALARVDEPWSPRTVAVLNDYDTLGPGQLYVVPRGVHHQPVSVEGADVVLIEPSATINTGDTPSHLTAERRLA